VTASSLALPATTTPEDLVDAELSTVPVRTDGSKAPAAPWQRYQHERADLELVRRWVESGYGLGVVCGAISGRLEMTEFEGDAVRQDLLVRLAELVREAGLDDLWQRLMGGWVVASPSGGLHFYYRLADADVPGNQKLAASADHQTLVETRGEGGYAVAPPSQGSVHPSGQPWVTLTGSPATIPAITASERDDLHRLIRTLDQRPVPAAPSPFQQPRSSGGDGVSPGDDFAARTSWAEILEPAGWRRVSSQGEVTHWCRPGKATGISATTGYGGGDWFYPFTSSTAFDPERTYTKLGAYAVLHHGGDHHAAAKALQARGFGRRAERPTVTLSREEKQAPDFPWEARESLSRIHAFARARRTGPFAVLGIALARVLATTSPRWVLPPLVGGVGSLNAFVAVVGASGAGKGAATSAAADAVPLDGWRDPVSEQPLQRIKVGSGEGLPKQYARWQKGEKDRPATVVRIRESVLFDVPEVDTLTALQQRQGATLSSTLRELFSGEEIGFAYADQEKAVTVQAHTYRAALILGVQPLRARRLFETDSDGGLPQRFLWVPTDDPEAPDEPPDAPEPLTIRLPVMLKSGLWQLALCAEARAEIDAHRLRTLRGGQADPLDAHRLHLRQKLAAGLAVLDGHLGTAGITIEDWSLAGALMVVSDRTREAIRASLRDQASSTNQARGRADGERQAEAEETVDAAMIAKAAKAALAKLTLVGDWLTTKQLRAALPGRVRPYLAAALDRLADTGLVDVEEIAGQGQPGHRYRRKR
jgi:hypothetical protein